MYYKRKSKTNWPVVITASVAVFFLVIISTILLTGYLRSKQEIDDGPRKTASTIAPNVTLTLNTEEGNQEKVIIRVKIMTIDDKGLDRIIIPGQEEIPIEEDGRKEFEADFEAKINGKYEVQAYGKNGVFGSETIQVSNINVSTSINPYIPEGFTKVESTAVATGLVVKDSSGNEYVWVPVDAGQLISRRDETSTVYFDNSEEYSQFVNSVGKYHGFYVARYEATLANVGGVESAVSLPGYSPTAAITYNKARKIAKEVAEVQKYKDLQTSILSNVAWDTMLAWLDRTQPGYSSSLSYGNYSSNIMKTGSNQKDKINEIYDLAGNVREWTSEQYNLSKEEKEKLKRENDIEGVSVYNVMRGGSITSQSTAARTNIGNPASAYANTGFRFVLYKR